MNIKNTIYTRKKLNGDYMELTEMIQDAMVYPSKNIKALVIYMLLGVILGIVVVSTGLTTLIVAGVNMDAGLILAIIGIIVVIALFFLIDGYALDIIKIAIERGENAPEVDFNRQVSNGIKFFAVSIVYMIIPILITIILGLIFRDWIVLPIGFILLIIFGLGLAMAECRLAQTDSLAYALDVKGSLDDLISIGVLRVIVTIVVVAVISALCTSIVSVIIGLAGSPDLTSIVTSIVSVYMLFFANRVSGLLYSEL